MDFGEHFGKGFGDAFGDAVGDAVGDNRNVTPPPIVDGDAGVAVAVTVAVAVAVAVAVVVDAAAAGLHHVSTSKREIIVLYSFQHFGVILTPRMLHHNVVHLTPTFSTFMWFLGFSSFASTISISGSFQWSLWISSGRYSISCSNTKRYVSTRSSNVLLCCSFLPFAKRWCTSDSTR